MKYGEMRDVTYRDIMHRYTFTAKEAYKYASWNGWHTNNSGDGLWIGDKQIEGTCQFTVRGCQTEKAAIAKIRKYAKSYRDLYL